MFPGYLFVELPVVDNAVRLEILKTHGVVKILGKPRERNRSRCPTRRSMRSSA